MGSCINEVNAILKNAGLTIAGRHTTFLDNPDDPETNHKLRVSIRTLRSLIDFMSPWQKSKQNERIQDDLKRVVKKTSRLRELDVLCEMAREGGASDELIAFCESKAADERAKVLKSLSSRKYTNILERAIDETCTLQWKKQFAKGKDALKARDIRAHYKQMVGSLQTDLATLDEDDYPAMHEVRKRAKQVRYVSEQFSELLGENAAEQAKLMKAEQDRLGALCDAKVNREIVESFIVRAGLSPALAGELLLIVA